MIRLRSFAAAVALTCLFGLCTWCVALGQGKPETNASDTLTIASFNIQVFGRAKARKTAVMKVLAEIITRFDLVAIQEIRDKSGAAIRKLAAEVDALGTPYALLVSPRLGRKEPREAYAFLYCTETLTPVGEQYLYQEPTGTDFFPREPFIARFKCTKGNFTFVLINLHTDPDTATREIHALKEVLAFAQRKYPQEKDFIILGDLNADCKYFNDKQPNPLPATRWLVKNNVDTTVKSSSCTYDRIIITAACLPDFTGEVGVFRYDQEFDLSSQESIEVSDHFPVWARFFTYLDNY